jgi:hypothetical protein
MRIVEVHEQLSPEEETCDRGRHPIPPQVQHYYIRTDDDVSYTLCEEHIDELQRCIQQRYPDDD